MDVEDLIPVEDRVITLTHFGYLKSQSVDTYKTQHRGGRGISGMQQREEDFVQELFIASSHDYIMFFTNHGRCYRLKTYEIGDSSRASKGINVVNLLPIESDEKITAMIKMSRFDEDLYLVMMTKNGIIKRTHLSQYRNVRRSGLIAISLDEGDELCGVRLTNGNNELLVATREGYAIRFKETDARAMGRNARGVKAITLEGDDKVVDFARIRNDGSLVLTVSEDGKGRRTDVSEYRLQTRGGKGIRNYYTEKHGKVAGVKMVGEEDDVFLISDDGIIIRVAAAEITKQSRYGGGVRVMRLDSGRKVVTLARAPGENIERPNEAILGMEEESTDSLWDRDASDEEA